MSSSIILISTLVIFGIFILITIPLTTLLSEKRHKLEEIKQLSTLKIENMRQMLLGFAVVTSSTLLIVGIPHFFEKYNSVETKAFIFILGLFFLNSFWRRKS